MKDWLDDNRHRLIGWLWVAALVPGVTIWRESIIFVIVCSCYANAESSFGTHHAKDDS